MNTPAPSAVVAPVEAMDLAVHRERRLVEAARSGDGKAFGALVGPHLGVVYRLAARACGDETLAEDAVQEALDIAFRQLDRYEPGTSIRAFLAAIAVTRAKTLARGERRRRVREEVSAGPEGAATPADLVSAQDLQRRVMEAMDSLPEKRRQAALLRLDGGLSHAEIAQALGSTERSVRVLVHMALKELRARLADALGNRPSRTSVAPAATRSMP